MPRQQLHRFVRLYLESKKAYPRNFPILLALIYGASVYLIVRELHLTIDGNILSNLMRSSFLLVSMLACAESVMCVLRKSTASRLLLVSVWAALIVAAAGAIGPHFDLFVFFEAGGMDQGVLAYAMILALLVAFDQTMDVSLLDIYK